MSSRQPKQSGLSVRAMLVAVAVITLSLISCVVGVYLLLAPEEEIPDLSVPVTQTESIPIPPGQAAVLLDTVVVANGLPSSVMCLDSYTVSPAEARPEAVVAVTGEKTLTNAQLQIYYLGVIGEYRSAGNGPMPDFSLPLDQQPCPLGDGTLSWQHYFLRRAVGTWQAVQALLKGADQPQLITEEAYTPNLTDDLHGKYVADTLPVNSFLYADQPCFTPNLLHQDYLDRIPEVLEDCSRLHGCDSLADYAESVFGGGVTEQDLILTAYEINKAYMYFTERSYDAAVSDEDIRSYLDGAEAGEGTLTVDLRHILLIPEGASVASDGRVTATEEQWEQCLLQARTMMQSWEFEYLTRQDRETNFARLANTKSADGGSALNGGLYSGITPGQLIEELDEWCFDPGRQVGDMEILRSEAGCHVVYLSAMGTTGRTEAGNALLLEQEDGMWSMLSDRVPLTLDYSAAALWADCTAEPIPVDELLYPDVAHERFPETMVYLQQDYLRYPYGSSTVGRGGCGITTMAMLATYMTDTVLTPAMMASRYANYHDSNGTNGDIFRYVPAELGFFLDCYSYRIEDAIDALNRGQRVISLQRLGVFTSGGHYLLLQRYYPEDDTFQVRDSNIYNYARLSGHKVDYFTRADILSGSTMFYIMQPKIVRIPACTRCGDTFDDRGPEILLKEDYLCTRCACALSRRENFLTILADSGE